jgi:hypothetical protein
MAAVQHMRGVKLLIKVGDGADPEVFSLYCSINAERSFGIRAETNRIVVPDCDDPDAPGWLITEKVSLSGDISGGGTLNTPDVPDFDAWARSSDTRNVQVHMDSVSGANGGGYWEGAYHLTEFVVTGAKGNLSEVAITLQSSGEVPFTANA